MFKGRFVQNIEGELGSTFKGVIGFKDLVEVLSSFTFCLLHIWSGCCCWSESQRGCCWQSNTGSKNIYIMVGTNLDLRQFWERTNFPLSFMKRLHTLKSYLFRFYIVLNPPLKYIEVANVQTKLVSFFTKWPRQNLNTVLSPHDIATLLKKSQ